MNPEIIIEEYDKIYADYRLNHRDSDVFIMQIIALFSSWKTSLAIGVSVTPTKEN